MKGNTLLIGSLSAVLACSAGSAQMILASNSDGEASFEDAASTTIIPGVENTGKNADEIWLETSWNQTGVYLNQEEISRYLSPYENQDPEKLGSLGFYLYLGDRQAAAILAKGASEGYIRLDDPEDPSSMKNLLAALDGIDDCNYIRTELRGLHALNADSTLMAIAAVQSGASRNNMDHSRLYQVHENLAWGHTLNDRFQNVMNGENGRNPFVSWYLGELEAGAGDYSHINNIVKPTFTVTGFAFGSSEGTLFGAVCGQTFAAVSGRDDYVAKTSEFRTRINDYLNEIQQATEGAADNAFVAMYRLYNPHTGEHFYTASRNERTNLMNLGWKFEKVGWRAPKSGTPVYRLYNPSGPGDHHYTADANERDYLVSAGWKDEGIGWYSGGQDSSPMYRQYNPNASSGSHNYSADQNEREYLVSVGWKDEGIAWYAAE